MNYKNIFKYLLFLLPWFLSSLIFKIDTNYYRTLNKPFFAPPSIIFPIVWTILYILVAYSIYKVWDNKTKNYNKYLLINYISNQLYTFFFFQLKSNSIALIDTIIVLTSSIFLYIETKNIDNKYSKYIIPYIIWNAFALILSFSILILN